MRDGLSSRNIAVQELSGVVGIGSPTVNTANIIQAGTATLSAGSIVWVGYGTVFKAAPYFVATYSDGTVASVAGSPIGAGSALVTGETASKDIHWIAVGSGALI